MAYTSQNSVVFVDTDTYRKICNLDIEFKYLIDNNITNLGFPPSLFLEYIGFSGKNRNLFMNQFDRKIKISKNNFTVDACYSQIFQQYVDLLFKSKNILRSEILKYLNEEKERLRGKKSNFAKAYLVAYDNIIAIPKFIESIISFISLSRTSTFFCHTRNNKQNQQNDNSNSWLIDFNNDEDKIHWLKSIVLFSSNIAQLGETQFQIHPLAFLIKHSDLVLNLFDLYQNTKDLPNEVDFLFKLVAKAKDLLRRIKLEGEMEMADLDLFWFTYTGYYWNEQLLSVVGCTHDKKAIKRILPWRNLALKLLNHFHSIKFKGGVVKLFEMDAKFICEYKSIDLSTS